MYDFCKNALFSLLAVIVFISFILSMLMASIILFIGFMLRFTWNYGNLAIQKRLNYLFEI
jgi:hypothetical protein